MREQLRLGVNVDHVATIRNARGGSHPDPLVAARLAIEAGADGITAHLREDRRHIVDDDIHRLLNELECPINLEMAPTDEMVGFAVEARPHAVCLVPERRAERTTEGGLDAAGQQNWLAPKIGRLIEAGCRVSLFIAPEPAQLEAARRVHAPVVELHTGEFCNARDSTTLAHEIERLRAAARLATDLGLECHAGHGISFDTVGPIAAIQQIVELNIGHFLVGEAVFTGLGATIGRMRKLIDEARAASIRPEVAR
ncbi:MAG: pyridoxine 5'-phosphate synthase [Alphaproteobacteria bacterium]|nr:pyridoxine 5'-phosphate synthase [Alphaproteobacteria bacterium]